MNRKYVFISLFVILGVILSFIVHAVLEIAVLSLLTKDFNKYGLGISWNSWYMIHHIGTVLLLLFGIFYGFKIGRRSA